MGQLEPAEAIAVGGNPYLEPEISRYPGRAINLLSHLVSSRQASFASTSDTISYGEIFSFTTSLSMNPSPWILHAVRL